MVIQVGTMQVQCEYNAGRQQLKQIWGAYDICRPVQGLNSTCNIEMFTSILEVAGSCYEMMSWHYYEAESFVILHVFARCVIHATTMRISTYSAFNTL
jgi:hypothetical protein